MKRFNELNTEAQNTLIERHRDINVCSGAWADTIITDAKASGVSILSFDVEKDFYCNIDSDDIEVSWLWLDRLQERYDTLTSDTAVINALSDYDFTDDADMI